MNRLFHNILPYFYLFLSPYGIYLPVMFPSICTCFNLENLSLFLLTFIFECKWFHFSKSVLWLEILSKVTSKGKSSSLWLLLVWDCCFLHYSSGTCKIFSKLLEAGMGLLLLAYLSCCMIHLAINELTLPFHGNLMLIIHY